MKYTRVATYWNAYAVLLKKSSANEIELNRTISRISHITEFIKRIRECERQDVGQKQRRFVNDTGTRITIFMIRIISKRSIFAGPVRKI